MSCSDDTTSWRNTRYYPSQKAHTHSPLTPYTHTHTHTHTDLSHMSGCLPDPVGEGICKPRQRLSQLHTRSRCYANCTLLHTLHWARGWSCDHHVTLVWLSSCDCHVTIMWPSCDCHVTIMWSSCAIMWSLLLPSPGWLAWRYWLPY